MHRCGAPEHHTPNQLILIITTTDLTETRFFDQRSIIDNYYVIIASFEVRVPHIRAGGQIPATPEAMDDYFGWMFRVEP